MSTIFIENYRGKDIFYNPSAEKFFSDIDEGKEKGLIHLVRKEIDDYIKLNLNFKPFIAFYSLSFDSTYSTPKTKTVIGLRKDNGLQCEGGEQITNDDLKDTNTYDKCYWFTFKEGKKEDTLALIDIENKAIKELEVNIKFHKCNIEKLVNEMKGENLVDFRRRILGESNN